MVRGISLVLLIAGSLALLGLLASGSTSAIQPFNPTLKIAGISNQAPSANADITFRTTLFSGDHILGNWALMAQSNSWTIAADNHVPDGDVTAVGTMTIDKDCNGTPETYGPFSLTDQPSEGDLAHWFGNIAPFWSLALTVNGSSSSGFTISAIMTDALGVTLCTPQMFTITFCGHANPVSTAIVCGSGADPVVMTNPSSAGTYTWSGSFIDESGAFFASPSDSVCIGTTCAPPAPCPDADVDGWTDCAEIIIGTNPNLACGINAWPADLNDDMHVDISDVAVLASSFGKAVPPAPARYDIAPDPPDRVVDITDVARISALFGKSCTPPPTPTPSPSPTPTPVPTPCPDSDGDGWTNCAEAIIGTNPNLACGINAWPPDLNNDMHVDISDVAVLAGSFGQAVPPAPARYDIAPDPPDRVVDITDVARISALFGKSCVP